MANYDDNAFNSMNNSAGGDMYITGGAITMSEYEQNMNPDEQSKYEAALMENFQNAYARDPYKKNLDFKHWLGSLNSDLYRERAQKYEDIQAENNGIYKIMGMDPIEGALIQNAGIIQKLAHLHTGRIEDLIEIVESNAQEVPAQGPESMYEGGGDQGPF
jgi:hypothetical protein